MEEIIHNLFRKASLCSICVVIFSQILSSQSWVNTQVESYLNAIRLESVETKIQECEFLLSTSTDSLILKDIAKSIYDFYYNSLLMGDETVAVYMADRIDLGPQAREFARFNRQSLIGKDAPILEGLLENFNKEKFTLLYFYDTDCSKCLKLTKELVHIVGSHEDLDFIAFYAGDKFESWKKYILDYFPQDFPVRHLWDPEINTDFQVKYAVNQTPRLFLISAEGKIVGRNLDAVALNKLLESYSDDKDEIAYGSSLSHAFYDNLFAQFGSDIKTQDINRLIDYIAEHYKSDAQTKKQMLGDLLYYLALKKEGTYKEANNYLIDNYILNDTELWNAEQDSLLIIPYAQILSDLLHRASLGSKIANIRLKGLLYKTKNGKEFFCKRSLDRLGAKTNIIIFHSDNCSSCVKELEVVKSMKKSAKEELLAKGEKTDINVFLINVDKLEGNKTRKKDKTIKEKVLNTFDLTVLPLLIETDKKGIIVNRYFSLLSN